MSNQMKQWLSDDAERLFKKVAQEEDKDHHNTRDLTREYLDYLGFASADAVRNAVDEISFFATNGKRWDNAVCLMRVEDGKLICGPHVVRAWHDYEEFRTD
jgi:hypothetical protein